MIIKELKSFKYEYTHIYPNVMIKDGKEYFIINRVVPFESKENKENYERIIDWITFYRRNIPVFVEHYLGIPLHWYQIIWLYLLNIYITVVIIAGRASAKSFVIAIFSCAKAILYPNTKVVVASGKELIFV